MALDTNTRALSSDFAVERFRRMIEATETSTTTEITTAVTAAQLPVGSVFLTIGNTNPGTLLGYGTWTQRASGLLLVGV